jgi:Zn-dependent protease
MRRRILKRSFSQKLLMASGSVGEYLSCEPMKRSVVAIVGIPVQVTPSFFLVPLLLALGGGYDWRRAASWIVVASVSILVHELGHALLIRRFGGHPSIELYSLGGLTSWGETTQPITRARDIAVSLAGPGAGFLLAGLLVAVQKVWTPAPDTLAATALRQALWVNWGWGLVNLLPIIPLDGGRVFEQLLTGGFGEAGARRARQLSILFAAVAGAVSLHQRWFWCVFLAVSAIGTAYRELRQAENAVADGPLRAALDQAAAACDEGDATRALELSGPLVGSLRGGAERARLGDLRARALLALDRPEEAQQALALIAAAGYTPRRVRVGQVLLALRQPEEAIRVLEEAVDQALGASADPDALDAPVALLGEAYQQAGRLDELLPMARHLTALGRPALHSLDTQLFAAGRFEDSAQLAEMAFTRHGHPDDAYNAACGLARLGKPEAALGWLQRAIEAGYDSGSHLDEDPDLAPVRSLPGYAALRQRIQPADK